MTSNKGIKTTKDNAEKTAYKILKKIFRNANLLKGIAYRNIFLK
jgi:hypothetical protein